MLHLDIVTRKRILLGNALLLLMALLDAIRAAEEDEVWLIALVVARDEEGEAVEVTCKVHTKT